ncbi:MAG: hypothetical protein K8R64_03325 [Methanosarcinaceae archaeon]|nr:hypothetical protein [Methanosarcinaceae archaeon]
MIYGQTGPQTDLLERIQQIHRSNYRAVIAITGGGTAAIHELLQHGNGSSTLLEANVPYSSSSLDSYLGQTPEKYCSPITARAMAMVAYRRAIELLANDEEDTPHNLIGIGATCTLIKGDRERIGRKHEIHVGLQSFDTTYLASLELVEERTREEEEAIVSWLILNTLAVGCDVESIPGRDGHLLSDREPVVTSKTTVPESVGDILAQPDRIIDNSHIPRFATIKCENGDAVQPATVVFPGSFDPCHKNHIRMAMVAYELYDRPVHFEISMTNVDKPPIDLISLQMRLDCLQAYCGERFMGDIYLTSAPLFMQKASLFPGATFVVGADTIDRIFQVRYYRNASDLDRLIDCFREQDIHFLVFQREGVELYIDPQLRDMCDVVPLNEYQDDGTSSSTIRNQIS